ncbi:hypothetical protein AAW31_09200 [Nitrosomonas communis]|uniref:Uncharacterized protein n=1 Tax=Nitrosomonas communis TaxID=44574 RepID=A0A0F7KEP4_9PROT|nr:hypothetical protein AAW31_09200 [Nitrosomonas communis]
MWLYSVSVELWRWTTETYLISLPVLVIGCDRQKYFVWAHNQCDEKVIYASSTKRSRINPELNAILNAIARRMYER